MLSSQLSSCFCVVNVYVVTSAVDDIQQIFRGTINITQNKATTISKGKFSCLSLFSGEGHKGSADIPRG